LSPVYLECVPFPKHVIHRIAYRKLSIQRPLK